MAPTNKAFKEGNSYEAAYPLKRTRCVKAHRPRKNFWKRALNLLRETLLCREKFVKICEFTFSTIACLTTERKCNSEDLEAIKTQLQEKILEEKEGLITKDTYSFISSAERTSAHDFAGLQWTTNANKSARKAGKGVQFLQNCISLTLETMTDIDAYILAQLLTEHQDSFPRLHLYMIHYKKVIQYLQEQVFHTRSVLPKIIQALNHWFTIMPLLDEIRYYTGWLYLLNIKAYLLDADALLEILAKTEEKKKNVS